jgi:hypothetical protein
MREFLEAAMPTVDRASRGVFPRYSILCALLVVVALLAAVRGELAAQPPAKGKVAEALADRVYIGANRCGVCHLKEYKSWQTSKHGKDAWEKVPDGYRADPECLKCHTTGYGQPGGFKDAASTPGLKGVSCEACHGPGSKHEEVCKPLAEKKKLSPDEKKAVRESIFPMLPHNVCVMCHLEQRHKEHPKVK